VRIAVLGPGGVGGLVAGALARAGEDVVVVARESTVQVIAQRGLRVSSVRLGDFTVHPAAVSTLESAAVSTPEPNAVSTPEPNAVSTPEPNAVSTPEPNAPVHTLIVATKAIGLSQALERIAVEPTFVLPLLNGLDHLALLRAHFREATVLAGAIRVEADRPEPGVVVHTSPFLRIDMASHLPVVREHIQGLAQLLTAAGVPARVLDSEPQVIWSKLVRLNALACTTSAYDRLLGEILATPELRAELVAAIEEGSAVARAERASVADGDPLAELTAAHPTLGSSMQRDIAAGRTPELDAIPGAVLRAGARHGLACPTIARLTAMIAARAGVPLPVGA
jgi:2-dehydropantoate 2-reductase